MENDARAETSLPDPLPRNVRRIPLERNYGTTGSINRGVRESESDYILLLNNDIELHPEFLARLLAVMSDGSIAFATGKLLQATNRVLLDGAGDALLLGGGAYRLGQNQRDVGQFDKDAFVLAGCGAATLFRRSAFLQVEGLDEDFFAYLDDVDLGLRVRLAGYSGVYVAEAVAYHVGSATLGDRWHPKIVELLTRNQLLLLFKDYPGSVLLRLLPHIAVFQSLWLALLIRRGCILPYFRGLLGILPRLRAMLRKRRSVRMMRRISSAEFLSLLQRSEAQIREWQRTMGSNNGFVLHAYFAIFSDFKTQ